MATAAPAPGTGLDGQQQKSYFDEELNRLRLENQKLIDDAKTQSEQLEDSKRKFNAQLAVVNKLDVEAVKKQLNDEIKNIEVQSLEYNGKKKIYDDLIQAVKVAETNTKEKDTAWNSEKEDAKKPSLEAEKIEAAKNEAELKGKLLEAEKEASIVDASRKQSEANKDALSKKIDQHKVDEENLRELADAKNKEAGLLTATETKRDKLEIELSEFESAGKNNTLKKDFLNKLLVSALATEKASIDAVNANENELRQLREEQKKFNKTNKVKGQTPDQIAAENAKKAENIPLAYAAQESTKNREKVKAGYNEAVDALIQDELNALANLIQIEYDKKEEVKVVQTEDEKKKFHLDQRNHKAHIAALEKTQKGLLKEIKELENKKVSGDDLYNCPTMEMVRLINKTLPVVNDTKADKNVRLAAMTTFENAFVDNKSLRPHWPKVKSFVCAAVTFILGGAIIGLAVGLPSGPGALVTALVGAIVGGAVLAAGVGAGSAAHFFRKPELIRNRNGLAKTMRADNDLEVPKPAKKAR